MLVLAWEYSAPPLRLHSTGLGELDTALVVTALVPFAGYYLQAPGLQALPLLLCAIAPLCALQFAMLLAIEFPDAAGDARPASARWWCAWVDIGRPVCMRR
jgi:1,4-dihydroxy-2-naphthoate octaprenyltransferase